MSTRLNFCDEITVSAISQRLVKELRPLVKNQLKARNVVRENHSAMVDRIAKLKARQMFLQDQIIELRAQGAARLEDDKFNQGISAKIANAESESRENVNWLSDLQPRAETMAAELAGANRTLLESLREHLEPLRLKAAEEMNAHLLAASRLRHSFPFGVARAIAEVGEDEALGAGVYNTLAFRLQVDKKSSTFISPAR